MPSQTSARSIIFIGIAGIFASIAISALCVHPARAAQSKASNLPAILAQMNAASARFTSAQADLHQELFTQAVNDTEKQTGQIYFLRKSGATQMGLRMYAPDAAPGAEPVQIVQFKDGKLESLNTGTSQVDVFPVTGKNQSTAETVMTLGFGGSGADLQKSWTITDQGSDKMNEGGAAVEVEKLDLVSRDPNIRNNFSHITIWVDPARDISLKQESFEASGGVPSGDTRTVYYTDIRLNQPANTASFAIKCKGKCTYVNH